MYLSPGEDVGFWGDYDNRREPLPIGGQFADILGV
jgi:hypothetical protein